MSEREFEIVVWGASGFTGSLVAAHLAKNRDPNRPLRWALGGRDSTKLEAVAAGLDDSAFDGSILIGDSHDRESLDRIVRRTSVICSTVGPYARHGSELVAACVEQGTHYCDLSGEVQWMREMLDRHQARAQQTGARLVHCCGFDAIPSDLGCYFLQQHVKQQQGHACDQVKMRVGKSKGTFSGGTVASLLNVLDEQRRNRRAREILADPYALNPPGQRHGPDGPDRHAIGWDEDVKSWIAPFVMAPINTRVVRRTNALLEESYGPGFRYDEAVMTGSGAAGWLRAKGIAFGMKALFAAVAVGPARAALEKWFLPSPGQGPSADERERGFFNIRLIGTSREAPDQIWTARVTGDRDPGYGSTARMLGESALCLARDTDELPAGGGFWTPAACFGQMLIARLEASAGMRFILG